MCVSTSTLVTHINEAFKLYQKYRRANAALESETGNMMEHHHLIKHCNPTVQKHGPTPQHTNSGVHSKVWTKEIKMGKG